MVRVNIIEKYDFLLTRFYLTKDRALLREIREELAEDGYYGSEALSRVMFDNPELFDVITISDMITMDNFHLDF